MKRILYPLLISLGVTHAYAQDAESIAGAASGAMGESAAALHKASDALAVARPAAGDEGANDAAAAQVHRISNFLVEKFGLARAKADRITTDVISSASKYSLPPALVLAIISIESRFREKAHGANGATGLMQIVPAAHRHLVRNIDLTQPAANIEAGSAILRGYIELARGDVAAALKSYGGSTAYARKVSGRARDFEASVAGSAASEPTDARGAR
jgi:soluble lytic murein transglycosylase-like protein